MEQRGIPKLKVQASVLPATQTPKPLTGRGGGKKNLDLFAAHYFPKHRHSKGIKPPNELVRPAKRAAPLAPAGAAGSAAKADARPGRDKERNPWRKDTCPACDLNLEQPPPLLNVSPPKGHPDGDTHADAPWSDSSYIEVFSSSESWESTLQRRVRRPKHTPTRRRNVGTPARRPREPSDTHLGNATRRKYRKCMGKLQARVTGAISGVKWRLQEAPGPMAKSRRRTVDTRCVAGPPVGQPVPQQSAPLGHLAPLPMCRSALVYMRRTGVLTPTRLACIPVLDTAPRDPTVPPCAPAAARRDVPPGIARMLRHLHSPNRSTACPPPPPVAATVVPRHSVRRATENAHVERVNRTPKGIQGLLRRGSSPPPAITRGPHHAVVAGSHIQLALYEVVSDD